MPKKKKANILSPAEQSKRFRETAEKLVADGGPNRTEAGRRFERILRRAADIGEPDKSGRGG